MEKKVKKLKVRLLETEERELRIHTEYIKLDAALKFADVAQSGGHAKILIEEERVRVNGEVCTVRGRKLYDGDVFAYRNLRFTVKRADEDQ